ncbi:MAG: Ig-like domain repeat protein [Janthinobacterium lividum]
MSALATVAGCGTNGSASTVSSGTNASTTTLTASATTAEEGVKVTLTATVSPSAAAGTVTFYDGATSLGTATLTSGSAALSTTFSSTGAQVLTATYAGDTAYAASTSSAVTVTISAAATASCSASIEGEEGPYFVDDSASGYLRTNIVSNLDGTSTQAGVPLALTIYVFDSKNSCAPMQGVQVDIWSCNALGVYSAESSESTVGESWLRGYQLTDVTGKVQFTTVIPGWYGGRTNHIHLRFRSTYDESDASGSNTMQLFFDQTLVNTLSTSVTPYSTEGTNPTTNANDHVYTPEEEGTTLLTLEGSTSAGYTTTFNAYMPI